MLLQEPQLAAKTVTEKVVSESEPMVAPSLTEASLSRIVDSVPLADFKEEMEFGREEQEFEVDGYLIHYTVSAYLFKQEFPGGYYNPSDVRSLRPADVCIDNLIVFELEGEEVKLTQGQIDAIETQIKNTVEY